MASLAPTFGRGAMTNNWVDIKNTDVVLAMGGNPAENHPCGFKWVIEAKLKRGAKLVSVDPRFHRTAAVSDHFVQIRAGTDIAFLGGLIHYTLEKKLFHEEYVKIHTSAPLLVKDSFAFADGVFSGWDEEKKKYDKTQWGYQLDEKGFAKTDPTLQDPRCVFQLLKQHFSRYTADKVAEITGCPKEGFLKAAELICSTGTADRVGTIMYALGWTHHSFSTQIIRTAAILQLLLGNIGRPGGGVNALRGHANIQGGTDHGMAYHALPGYLAIPKAAEQKVADYLDRITPKSLSPRSMNYWSNAPKFFNSLMKAWYGRHAVKENGFAYDWLPKVDGNYSWVFLFDDMLRGKLKGFLDFGMNPVANGPNTSKMIAALSKLDWMMVAECFATETAEFWRAPGVKSADVKTEVFLLPAGLFAEKDGSFTNSSRWAQWKQKALPPPGQAKNDQEILALIMQRVRELYAADAQAKFPDPVLKLTWDYSNVLDPALDEIAREINGHALEDLADAKGQTLAKKGQRLNGFALLREDGSTSSGNWIYCGSYPEEGNLMTRRDPRDPSGLGVYPGWAWNWPMNRRILYNRASADAQGRPWDPARSAIQWDGEKWTGDVPDLRATSRPEEQLGAFMMLPEGVAKLYAPEFNDGPFPEFYEPVEAPVENVLHPKHSANPVVPRFSTPFDALGTADEFPIVCTTFRLTEHFHYWTKHISYTAQIQPEFFVEMPEGLAQELKLGVADRVRVSTKRGSIEGKVVITKRIKPMSFGGKKVWQVALPIHWGFKGQVQGPMVNLLTHTAVDPNAYTPEYKGFLCKVEKI